MKKNLFVLTALLLALLLSACGSLSDIETASAESVANTQTATYTLTSSAISADLQAQLAAIDPNSVELEEDEDDAAAAEQEALEALSKQRQAFASQSVDSLKAIMDWDDDDYYAFVGTVGTIAGTVRDHQEQSTLSDIQELRDLYTENPNYLADLELPLTLLGQTATWNTLVNIHRDAQKVLKSFLGTYLNMTASTLDVYGAKFDEFYTLVSTQADLMCALANANKRTKSSIQRQFAKALRKKLTINNNGQPQVIISSYYLQNWSTKPSLIGLICFTGNTEVERFLFDTGLDTGRIKYIVGQRFRVNWSSSYWADYDAVLALFLGRLFQTNADRDGNYLRFLTRFIDEGAYDNSFTTNSGEVRSFRGKQSGVLVDDVVGDALEIALNGGSIEEFVATNNTQAQVDILSRTDVNDSSWVNYYFVGYAFDAYDNPVTHNALIEYYNMWQLAEDTHSAD